MNSSKQYVQNTTAFEVKANSKSFTRSV